MRFGAYSPIKVQVSPTKQIKHHILQTEVIHDPWFENGSPASSIVPKDNSYLIQSLIQRIVHLETSLKDLRKENQLIKQNQQLIFESHTNKKNENENSLILSLQQQQEQMSTEIQNFMRICTTNLQNFHKGLSDVMRMVMRQPLSRSNDNIKALEKLQSTLVLSNEERFKSQKKLRTLKSDPEIHSDLLLSDMLDLRTRINGAIDTVTRRSSQVSGTRNQQKNDKQSQFLEEVDLTNKNILERSNSEKIKLSSKKDLAQNQEKTMTARILANILQNNTSSGSTLGRNGEKEFGSYTKLHSKVKVESPSDDSVRRQEHGRHHSAIVFDFSNKHLTKHFIQSGKIDRRNRAE